MPEYQVFHQQAVKSFSAGEDNEHQRRWTESQWEAKASNKKFNYDKSGFKTVWKPLVRKTLTKDLKRPNTALPAT